jgi:AcrR family transcriptional regulator
MSTPAGSITRQKLVDAATRSFAENGVTNASLLEIARQAGQRNRGAVHYHFGSREGLLVAVLAQYAGALHEQHTAMLAALTPDDDLVTLITRLLRPGADLAEDGWRGRCFLLVLDDLTSQDPATLEPQVREVLEETGGQPVYDQLAARMPELPDALEAERLALFTSFVLGALADRARALEHAVDGSRPPLDSEEFTANLAVMAASMLSAPVPKVAAAQGGATS